jgi:hypothetical protein
LWHHANKERANECSRKRFEQFRDSENKKRLERHRLAMAVDANYREVRRVKSAVWREKNPEKASENSRNWCKAYPWKNSAKSNKYRATKLCATPKWVDKVAILKIYESAAAKTDESGYPFHVDHIVPLNGKLVCGLHVPWNLRVIPATENMKKGSKLIEVGL